MGLRTTSGSRLLKKSICFVLGPSEIPTYKDSTLRFPQSLRPRIWSFFSSLRPMSWFSDTVGGFTYLAVMFSITLIGLSLTGAAQSWTIIMKREREAELLFRGDQIRKAIAAYYLTPGIARYPKQLEDLVKVPNVSATKRFLRKVYRDPITGGEWGLVKVGDGIKGVYSTSEDEPLKQGNFPEEYKFFEGKTKYSEWVFEFTPQAPLTQPQAQPQPRSLPSTPSQPK